MPNLVTQHWQQENVPSISIKLPTLLTCSLPDRICGDSKFYCPKKYGIHWSQNLHSVHRCAFCSLYDVFHLYRLLNANLMGLWVKILGSMCRCHACNKAGAMAEKCSHGCVSPQTWHWDFSSKDSPMCVSCCLLSHLRIPTFG